MNESVSNIIAALPSEVMAKALAWEQAERKREAALQLIKLPGGKLIDELKRVRAQVKDLEAIVEMEKGVMFDNLKGEGEVSILLRAAQDEKDSGSISAAVLAAIRKEVDGAIAQFLAAELEELATLRKDVAEMQAIMEEADRLFTEANAEFKTAGFKTWEDRQVEKAAKNKVAKAK